MRVDPSALMSGAQWRKAWPEVVDNGDDDKSALNFRKTRRRSEENPDPTYHLSYDEKVFDTQQSLIATEKITSITLVSMELKVIMLKTRFIIQKLKNMKNLRSHPQSD